MREVSVYFLLLFPHFVMTDKEKVWGIHKYCNMDDGVMRWRCYYFRKGEDQILEVIEVSLTLGWTEKGLLQVKVFLGKLVNFFFSFTSRRVSDEVFYESFCEFFIPTEDYTTATKLTGLGNTRKLFKMESFRGPQRAWFHFVHSTVKFENRKNKKSFDERNGESDRRGDKSSSFVVNKTRISVKLQMQLNSLRKGVVRLETWIWQIMVLVIITWETSTMVP